MRVGARTPRPAPSRWSRGRRPAASSARRAARRRSARCRPRRAPRAAATGRRRARPLGSPRARRRDLLVEHASAGSSSGRAAAPRAARLGAARRRHLQQQRPRGSRSVEHARAAAPAIAPLAASSTPKTARRMTSSVIACIAAASRTAADAASARCARSAISAHRLAVARMRSPWNDGSIRRRWRRCSGAVEQQQRARAQQRLEHGCPRRRSRSGSPVKTSLATADRSRTRRCARPRGGS